MTNIRSTIPYWWLFRPTGGTTNGLSRNRWWRRVSWRHSIRKPQKTGRTGGDEACTWLPMIPRGHDLRFWISYMYIQLNITRLVPTDCFTYTGNYTWDLETRTEYIDWNGVRTQKSWGLHFDSLQILSPTGSACSTLNAEVNFLRGGN